MSQINTQNEVEINIDEPFENCKFNRKDNAEILENVLKYTKSNAVINLTAPWGYGKTTFLKMFQQQLINNKTTCIYFSAWEYDYIEDPFSALIAHIQKELYTNEEIKDKNSLRKMFNTVMPVVANIGLKAMTANIFDFDSVEKIISVGDDTEKDIGKHVGKMAQNLLSNYIESSSQITLFKESLESFAIAQNGGCITIIIDELDRCRPDFSIEMLERVKHIMSVPGVKFVLGTDKEQLSESIKVLYGNNFDSIRYLERFIDFEYELDIPDRRDYIGMLIEEFNIINIVKDKQIDKEATKNDLIDITSTITTLVDMDLRSIRQIFFKLHLVVISIPHVTTHMGRNSCIATEYFFYKLLLTKLSESKQKQLYKDMEDSLKERYPTVISIIACEKYYKETTESNDDFIKEQFKERVGSQSGKRNYIKNNTAVANYMNFLIERCTFISEVKLNKYLKSHNNFNLK